MKARGIRVCVTLIIAASLVYISCSPGEKPAHIYRPHDNFSFLKIEKFIDDSARYFRAIDSVYAYLPPAEARYEIYACKRGYFYTRKRDYQKSSLYSDSLLLAVKSLMKEPGYLYWSSTAMLKKADDLKALRRYPESFGFYYLARETIFKTGDSSLFSDFNARLGMIAYQQKNYLEAAGYFKQALDQPLSWSHQGNQESSYMSFGNQQSYIDNIGLCFSKMGQSDSALYYFDSALSFINSNIGREFRYDDQHKKIIDTNYIQTAKAVIYGNQAKDLMAIGNDSAAERLLKESIRINRLPFHALEDVPYSLAKLSDLYLRHSRIEEAGVALKELKAGLDTSSNIEILQRWYQLMAHYSNQKGHPNLGYAYINQYMHLKDSLDITGQTILPADMHKEFAFLKNQYTISSLKQEDAQNQRYLWIALAGLAMCVAVLLLIWRNYGQSKKYNNLLKVLNKQVYIKNGHLQQALTGLEKSHEDNSRMMKVVAHDLRNPVGGIAGLTSILLKENNYTASQREMLEMISKSSNHAVELIHDLVHVNQSTKEIRKEPLALPELLTYCVEMLHLKAEEKNQKIWLNTSMVTVMGDREKLWRVFSNLISNAIKFSPENSDIHVALIVKGEDVIVTVKDQGIGIPETLKEKIFLSSGESKRKGTAGEPSFGLGLSICKQILEIHGGNIWFESGVGEGTTFFASFPHSLN